MPRPAPAKLLGKKSPYPGFIEPALASTIGKPPAGDRWLHEIKFDGYRVQLHIHASNITVYTRNGNDWTDRFKVVANAAWHLNVNTAIIDGEIVVPNDDGTTDFSQLQRALKASKPSDKLAMYAFDLLYLNGSDLRPLPLIQRKAMLQKLITKSELLYSEHFGTTGAELLKHACSMGLEGIVSKQKRAISIRRMDTWIKMTCQQRETLPIVGYAMKDNRFDGLILGRHDGDELIYAGKVDHGFTRDDEKDVRARLGPLVQKAQPLAARSRSRTPYGSSRLCWTEVEYRAKSAERKLRHLVIQRYPGGSVMSDKDEPEIVAKVYHEAPTTRTLYRLTSTAIADLTRSSRQLAIVAAANEADARIMAKKADAFAQDWTDEKLFASGAHDTGEDHVIGDVTFTSTPAKPPVGKVARRKSSTG